MALFMGWPPWSQPARPGFSPVEGAALPIPERTPLDAEVWITMEGWDGAMHQASIPLSQASPATIDWLKTWLSPRKATTVPATARMIRHRALTTPAGQQVVAQFDSGAPRQHRH